MSFPATFNELVPLFNKAWEAHHGTEPPTLDRDTAKLVHPRYKRTRRRWMLHTTDGVSVGIYSEFQAGFVFND